MTEKNQHPLEASFVTLAMSIASAAVMSLGMAPNPSTNETKVDLDMARFNIDLLDVLQKKTKGNLEKEEQEFMDRVLADLKIRFVEVSGHGKK